MSPAPTPFSPQLLVRSGYTNAAATETSSETAVWKPGGGREGECGRGRGREEGRDDLNTKKNVSTKNEKARAEREKWRMARYTESCNGGGI